MAIKSTFSIPRLVLNAFIPLEPPKDPPTPAVEGCRSITATRRTEIVICAIGKSFIINVWNIAREVCHIGVKNATIYDNNLIYKGTFLLDFILYMC